MMTNSGPDKIRVMPPSLEEARKQIDDLRNLNLCDFDIDTLKEKLSGLFKGYAIRAMVFEPGLPVFRGNIYDFKPLNRSFLTYPPKEKITKPQRANREHNPMFYCSGARPPPFFELDVQPGQFICISRRRTTAPLLVNNVGYHDAVFKKLQSVRAWDVYPGIVPALDPNFPTNETNTIIHQFLAEAFSEKIRYGDDHRYKLSAAIAERLLGNVTDRRDEAKRMVGPKLPDYRKFAGIMYPSIAMSCTADNLALTPEFVEAHLVLEQVEYLRVDSIPVPLRYKYTPIDFANSCDKDGTINWLGRVQRYTFPANAGVTASEIAGETILHFPDGTPVEPT